MAELNISERQAGDVTVLDMSGKITIGEGSVALRTAVRRMLEEDKKRILLNLAGVGYIDSSGIGELVSSYTAINKDGGQLKLLNLTAAEEAVEQWRSKMAELDVKERQAGDVTILDMSGAVRIGQGAVALRDSVRELIDGGKKKILLNLGGVNYIDSSGIGELIANYTTISRQGGQLKLLNLTDKIQSLLVITKLLTVFDTYDNEPDALNSFK